MLDVAVKYEKELQALLADTWYDEKYKYYHCATYCDVHKVQDNNWASHRFVSKNINGDIIGYISYSVNRNDDRIHGLGAINFTSDKLTFGKDLTQAIRDIFVRFNHRKLSFVVVVGNPIERSYDRMVMNSGGRIVGTYKEHVKLFDNKYYDEKLYEIMREDFLKSKYAKVDKSNIL